MTVLLAAGTAGTILKVAYSAVIASVLISVAFALAVLGFARSADMRRVDRHVAASVYTTLAVCALVLCAAAAVYGVILVGQKS